MHGLSGAAHLSRSSFEATSTHDHAWRHLRAASAVLVPALTTQTACTFCEIGVTRTVHRRPTEIKRSQRSAYIDVV